MRCSQARRQIAIYRELGPADRAALDAHLAQCPACARLLAEYTRQDALLSALPPLEHATLSWKAVRQQAVERVAPHVGRRVWAVVVLLLFLMGVGGGVVMAAEAALPGEPLYPLKRTMETVRLQLTRDQAQRQQLEARWAERRRQEVKRLVAEGREAALEIEGSLQGATEDIWRLDGLVIRMGEALQRTATPPVGAHVRMRVAVQGGEIIALEVHPMEKAPIHTPVPALQTSASPHLPSPPASLSHPGHGAQLTPRPSVTPRGAATAEPPESPAATVEPTQRAFPAEMDRPPSVVPAPPMGETPPPMAPPTHAPGGMRQGNRRAP